MSADISHAASNTSITRLSKGFERMVADYEDFKGGYQEELYNVKDHFPSFLQGKDICVTIQNTLWTNILYANSFFCTLSSLTDKLFRLDRKKKLGKAI